MTAEVTISKKALNSTGIILPASKSISNRALIIRSIGSLKSEILNLSEASDTQTLKLLLDDNSNSVNAGDGGTTLRFLLAYYCLAKREITVTASDSLKARPVSELINALRSLGASIEYIEEDGKLPVKISNADLRGGEISISGETSSQFISSLMMIGPYLPGGLNINIEGEILSGPYIHMTKSLMEYYGAEVKFVENVVTIKEGKYSERELFVEPDWSAASYWYEMVALSDSAEVVLPGLIQQSLQGDSAIASMMEQFGVTTHFNGNGVVISKNKNFSLPEYFTYDFSGCPDLGPAIATLCGALNITADLKGLKNFRLKESDRASVIQRELYNMNVKTDFCDGSKFKVYSGAGMKKWNRPVKTHNDHRIAMSFAPLALKTGSVIIENPQVVQKSYPGYFNDLQKAGFKVDYSVLKDK